MGAKRLNAYVYMETKINYIRNELTIFWEESGSLYANGVYPTKILMQDLPEWYIHCSLYHQYGYISAKDVKELLYVPNYVFHNHLYKDDLLYISYNAKIERQPEADIPLYTGYNESLYGSCIVPFTEAVGRYAGYDVSDILAAMAAKRQWYEEKNSPGYMGTAQ